VLGVYGGGAAVNRAFRCTLRNADPGLYLLRDGVLVLKTEYSDEHGPECYLVQSGERYHGDGYDVDAICVTDESTEAAYERWEVKK
jgi:hypothetical protein